MIKSIHTAFTKRFRPQSLVQDGRPHARAAGGGSQRGRRLNRAASPVLEALEDRRLLAAFVVDTLIDQNDGVGVNGVSLRDAIIAANTTAGSDTITFAPSLTAGGPVTLTLTLGELTVSDTIGTTTITGPGASLLSVSGNNISRVFVNAANVTSQISGLTIKDGRSPGATGGGGVANLGTLRLIDCEVSGNTAAFGAGFSNSGTLQIDTSAIVSNVATASGGGAIYNSGTGTVTLNRVVVNQNRAEGGLGGFGGAIYNISATGVVTMFSTDITQNTATSDGGGLRNFGTMTITESAVEDNRGTSGAGLINYGSLTIGRSTFSGNTASIFGGAIWQGAGTATITGSTLSGNIAIESGGGIMMNGGTMTLAASTLSGNTATSLGGGIRISAGGTMVANYALVAGNTAPSGPDIEGAVTFGWSNLIGNGTGMTGLVNGANGNLVGTQAAPIDPKLGPLANNGGPTKTMALLPGSPAINAGNAALNTDGRGLVRTVYDTLDIGAFEYKAMVESLVVTTTIDEDDGTSDAAFGTGTSLREAIIYADTRAGADTITFAPSLTAGGLATITLTLGQLQLTDTSGRTTITGPGAAMLSVDANQQNRVFFIATGASAAISGMTIKNGKETTVTGMGGGIRNEGTLELLNTVLSGNSASFGGAIYSPTNGTLVITSSTISGNSANDGSGGGIISGGELTVTNSTVSDNTAGSGGGGIFVEAGTASLTGSTISDNSATLGSGGGIASGGALTLTDSTVSGNSAGANGGGIYVEAGTASLTGSTISNNSATLDSDANGGGIYNNGTTTITATTISGNTALSAGGGISNDDNDGILTIRNSTLSGNTTSGYGGGIGNGGILTVINSTLSGNTATTGGGGIASEGLVTLTSVTIAGNSSPTGTGGGLLNLEPNAPFTINLTIVAGNTAATKPDIDGNVSSGGFNLIGDGTGMTGLTHGVNGNLVGTQAAPIDPMLGPLADNGGPTQTRALLIRGPAVNAGSDALIPSGVTTDQRGPGFNRIQATAVDIGAFESEFVSDFTAPTAKAAKFAAVKAGKKPYRFTIVYSDETMVDINSIGNRNIFITGPRKYKQWASVVSKPVVNLDRVVVTYQMIAPGKTWGGEDNGNYTVWLWAGQVRDVNGNISGKQKLGTIKVNVGGARGKVARAFSASPNAANVRRPATAAALPAIRTGLFNTTSSILMDGDRD